MLYKNVMLGEFELFLGLEVIEMFSDILRVKILLYVCLNIFGLVDEILKIFEYGLYFCFFWIEVK